MPKYNPKPISTYILGTKVLYRPIAYQDANFIVDHFYTTSCMGVDENVSRPIGLTYFYVIL